MLEKWERQPGRVGMLLGFIALPLSWFLRDTLLQLVLGFSSDTRPYFQLLHFFAIGAIPGAILGAGVSKAALSHRQGDHRRAKRHLVFHSLLVVLLGAGLIVSTIQTLQNASLKVVLLGQEMPHSIGIFLGSVIGYFPVHPALLMLFIGLLMRARR